MMAAADYRGNQQQPSAAADDVSPRRGAAGLHPQQPTRVKSFFRQNQNSRARKILVPLLYLLLATLYFYNLLFRDVGSGVHVLRENIDENITHASAPVWNSPEPDAPARLEPRSLADVTVANAEVAWKRKVDYEEHLKRRAEIREERRKKLEEAEARLKQLKLQRANGTVVDDGEEHDTNATQDVIVLKLPRPGNRSETPNEYVKRLASLSARGTPKKGKNHVMRNTRQNHASSTSQDLGLLPVLIMITMCTIFRVLVSLIIGHVADDGLDSVLDESDNEGNETNADGDSENAPDDDPRARSRRRGGLSSLVSTFGSSTREAARLRRRARAVRAHRQFQRFVDRLNAERTSNGERAISADTLRGLVNGRDFDGNDYDRLSSFVEENGPAVGSIFSYIGATEAEIGRCPSRTLEAGDELLNRSRLESGDDEQQRQTCSVCLEPYRVGETVRTIPCFHTFHTGCIDPWLAQRAECPICKHSAIG